MTDRWSGTSFPKRLSIKKADRWLSEHPEVNPISFWDDQIEKGQRATGRALKLAVIFLTISVVLQGTVLIMGLVGAR